MDRTCNCGGQNFDFSSLCCRWGRPWSSHWSIVVTHERFNNRRGRLRFRRLRLGAWCVGVCGSRSGRCSAARCYLFSRDHNLVRHWIGIDADTGTGRALSKTTREQRSSRHKAGEDAGGRKHAVSVEILPRWIGAAPTGCEYSIFVD